MNRNNPVDRGVVGWAVLGISLPEFWFALLLIFVFSVTLRWFPVAGYNPPSAGLIAFTATIFLPALALGIRQSALMTRMMRSSMLDVLNEPYITTARAQGLPEKKVIGEYAMRTASIPVVTVVGLSASYMLGGAVTIEIIFALPGLGRMLVEAVGRRDYPSSRRRSDHSPGARDAHLLIDYHLRLSRPEDSLPMTPDKQNAVGKSTASVSAERCSRSKGLNLSLKIDNHIVPIVTDIVFAIAPGEAVALVGESGCGKSITASAILGLPPENATVTGKIVLNGRDIAGFSKNERRKLCGSEIGFIFQEPMTALHPTLTIGHQITDTAEEQSRSQ